MIRLSRQDSTSSPLMKLEGELVVIRAPQEEDWKEWATLRAESRAFLTPWEPLWLPDTLSELVYMRRLRRHAIEWRDDEGCSFHVFDRRSGILVGGIGLSQIKRGVSQSGVIGYWVGERFARRGYTGEAARLVVNFAFKKLGLHRVEATCIPGNIASQKVLEKLGFEREGYVRQYLKIAGEWADHYLYAILERDWR